MPRPERARRIAHPGDRGILLPSTSPTTLQPACRTAAARPTVAGKCGTPAFRGTAAGWLPASIGRSAVGRRENRAVA